ncbi:MAG TPA: hypothetical protein VF989_05870 [Polyangiaceae bacterium]
MRRRKQFVVALAALVTSAGACRSRDATTLSEAGAVTHAVERLRGASNSEKGVALSALAAVPCSAPEVCALKTLCAGAYTKHVRALDGVRAARHALRAAPAGSARVAKLLDESQELLESAQSDVARCADAEGELKRNLRL